jgi:hypothetical protein|nr:MAG TPA: hypothetical protein [Inoviridae sp.]
MIAIKNLFDFMAWLFNQHITIGGFSFSLTSAVVAAGLIGLLLYFIHWLFEGDL